MSALINVEVHNAKIAEIEKAKSILDAAKPKAPLKFRVVGKCRLALAVDGEARITDAVRVYDHSNDSGYIMTVCDLIALAACTIKAFGPIPQELIDSVTTQ